VIEKNSTSKLATKYDPGYAKSAIPIATSKNITSSTILLDPTLEYAVKVVSRLGTIVSVNVPDNTTPPGPQGEDGDPGLACWDLDGDGIFDYVFFPPGDPADEDTDDNNAADAYDCLGNTPGPAGPPGQDGDPGANRILDDDLLNKPGIFLTMPSPFGNSPNNQNGLWGMTIANPTDLTMQVNKVVLNVMSPRTDPSDTMFKASPSDNCGPNPVSIRPNPNTNAVWKCITSNTIIWVNTTASGAIIPPRSAMDFFTSVTPGELQGGDDLDGFPIMVTVNTSMGQFGKTGYMSSMRNTNGPIVNLYLSDTMGSIATANMFGNIVMAPLAEQDVYINLAEFETTNTNYIKSGAQVVVNVPKNFTISTSPATIIADSPGFTNAVFYNNTGTDSVQLVADTNVIIGNSGAQAKTLKFTIRAPDATVDKLFIMYTLARGTAEPNLAGGLDADIGPLAEIVIKVDAP